MAKVNDKSKDRGEVKSKRKGNGKKKGKYGDILVRFDWAIKNILRKKTDHTVLEGLITSLLREKVKIHRFLESESNKASEKEKLTRADILAETENGELIIIEIQNMSNEYYFRRMLYGVSKVVSEYLEAGTGYDKVRKVYSINILYFPLGFGEDVVYVGSTTFQGLYKGDELRLTKQGREALQVSELREVFPTYYLLRVDEPEEELSLGDHLKEWMYFLRTEQIPEGVTAPGLEEAREQLSYLKMSREEQRAYRSYKELLDEDKYRVPTELGNAWEKGRAEGRAEGLAEGIELGRAGLEEACEAARLEGNRATAVRLLRFGMSVDDVASMTGLTEEQVRGLEVE